MNRLRHSEQGTFTDDVGPRGTAGTGGGRAWSATETAALARLTWFELGRFARSPFPLAGFVVATAVNSLLWLDPGITLDWDLVSFSAVQSAGYLCTGMVLAASIAAARNARHGQEPVAALPPWARTAAVALAAFGWGALLGTVYYGAAVVPAELTVPAGIVGYTSTADTITTALFPALAALAGAVLGAWFRSWMPATILAAPLLVSYFLWIEPLDAGGWQVAGVLGLSVLCGCLLLLRDGGEIRPAWRRATRTLAAGALLVSCLGAVVPSMATSETEPALPLLPRTEEPPRGCEEHDGVTYCAYEAYAPWIPMWADDLAPVVAALPEAGLANAPVVEDARLQPDLLEDLPAGVVWADDPDLSLVNHGLRADFASVTVGGSQSWGVGCSLAGQGRAVVAAWLVAHSVAAEEDPWALWIATDVAYAYEEPPVADLTAMLAVLDAPHDTVRDGLAEHWDTLVRADTTPERALELLGAPPRAEHREEALTLAFERLGIEMYDEHGEPLSYFADPEYFTEALSDLPEEGEIVPEDLVDELMAETAPAEEPVEDTAPGRGWASEFDMDVAPPCS